MMDVLNMYVLVRDHVNRQLDLWWLVLGPFLLDSTSPEFTCEPAYSTNVDNFNGVQTTLSILHDAPQSVS